MKHYVHIAVEITISFCPVGLNEKIYRVFMLRLFSKATSNGLHLFAYQTIQNDHDDIRGKLYIYVTIKTTERRCRPK